MSKRKTPVIATEDRNNPCWGIGYTARLQNVARRCNQFSLDTTQHHQWNHGWDQAHAERIAVKVVASDKK